MTSLVAVRLPSDDSTATFDAQPKQAPRKLWSHHGLEAGMVDERDVTESAYPVVGQGKSKYRQHSRSSNNAIDCRYLRTRLYSPPE